MRGIGILPELSRVFGSLRKSGKGLSVSDLFHQALCFFFDGTSRHLVHFDAVKQDAGYAGAIEMAPEKMASSHTMKRFFGAFRGPQNWGFRRVLQQLFLWRLQKDQPKVVVLGIDAMVM
ncbi:MAG: IS1380 family transposase, partial [Gemmatimonas sp.]|nr:IS1380 family transposase [Gemmatimonas sp.]